MTLHSCTSLQLNTRVPCALPSDMWAVCTLHTIATLVCSQYTLEDVSIGQLPQRFSYEAYCARMGLAR